MEQLASAVCVMFGDNYIQISSDHFNFEFVVTDSDVRDSTFARVLGLGQSADHTGTVWRCPCFGIPPRTRFKRALK